MDADEQHLTELQRQMREQAQTAMAKQARFETLAARVFSDPQAAIKRVQEGINQRPRLTAACLTHFPHAFGQTKDLLPSRSTTAEMTQTLKEWAGARELFIERQREYDLNLRAFDPVRHQQERDARQQLMQTKPQEPELEDADMDDDEDREPDRDR